MDVLSVMSPIAMFKRWLHSCRMCGWFINVLTVNKYSKGSEWPSYTHLSLHSSSCSSHLTLHVDPLRYYSCLLTVFLGAVTFVMSLLTTSKCKSAGFTWGSLSKMRINIERRREVEQMLFLHLEVTASSASVQMCAAVKNGMRWHFLFFTTQHCVFDENKYITS